MRHNIIDIHSIHKDKRFKSALIFLVLSGIFLLLYFWVNKSSDVPESVNKFVIKGHQKLSTREIITILGIQPGISFDRFNLAKLEENLRLHPRIKTAKISRQNDDRLMIAVTEKVASYLVKTGNHLYEINGDLNIISTDDVREADLCVLSGEFKATKGQLSGGRIDDLTRFVDKMFQLYPALKDRIAEINLSPDGEIYIYTYRPEKLKILMGTTMDMTQIRKLYAALAYFEAENKQAALLDLRGEDAVYH